MKTEHGRSLSTNKIFSLLLFVVAIHYLCCLHLLSLLSALGQSLLINKIFSFLLLLFVVVIDFLLLPLVDDIKLCHWFPKF